MTMQDNYKIAENFLKEKNIEYYRNHPFREFSSFYIGGNIDLYIVVKKIQEFLDIADEREKRGEKHGIAQGISQVAINMLKAKCDKEIIKKCTGLSDKKIKELEKTLEHV